VKSVVETGEVRRRIVHHVRFLPRANPPPRDTLGKNRRFFALATHNGITSLKLINKKNQLATPSRSALFEFIALS